MTAVIGGRHRMIVALLLCLTNTFLSGLLLLHHHGEQLGRAAVAQACGDTTQNGCAVVAASQYSEVAGVPLAAGGTFFYGSVGLLLLLAVVAGSEVGDAAAAVSVFALGASLILDVILLAVQAAAIHA